MSASGDPAGSFERMSTVACRPDRLCSFWFGGRKGTRAADPRTQPPLPWGWGWGKDENRLRQGFPSVLKTAFPCVDVSWVSVNLWLG